MPRPPSRLAPSGAPEDRNVVSLDAYAGLSYKGTLHGRDNDIFAAGINYTKLSNDLRDDSGRAFPSHHETIFEMTYLAVINHWISVQPDFQFIQNPGGTQNAPDAIVAGLRCNINFP